MKDVLYLAHRLPYPPNKGDKIRSFHLLRALASRYRVHLGTFVDAPEDRVHVDALRRYCASLYAPEINPTWRKLTALRGLLSGRALTQTYYEHGGLAAWCSRTVREHKIERAVIFSSAMAQFVGGAAVPTLRRVMDFCDIDSDKWRQYSDNKSALAGWIYSREAELLERDERRIASEFDVSVFVSDNETAAFTAIAPESATRVHTVRNGVDIDYFTPNEAHARPQGCEEPYVVFTGAMDYWANVEGVSWFVNEIWPQVHAAQPRAKFFIVGSRPAEAVQKLARTAGVVVTGSVPDVRPYLHYANVAVAPLRVARGIQNKVLEAMAMERVVVAVPAAVRGIDATPPGDVLVTENARDFARFVATLLEPASRRRSELNRNYVADRFHWGRNLDTFLRLVEGDVALAA
ncbi:MAG TPA: TIGR03087 family PEP-CTERM/XrtA system glycosyltransferase [Steroidobacteraceae bacterium]|nr:TIGR03087 family PEP-CTERM/XrtA system glycosyltransferase [Steroidobacteraceae bacterium]